MKRPVGNYMAKINHEPDTAQEAADQEVRTRRALKNWLDRAVSDIMDQRGVGRRVAFRLALAKRSYKVLANRCAAAAAAAARFRELHRDTDGDAPV